MGAEQLGGEGGRGCRQGQGQHERNDRGGNHSQNGTVDGRGDRADGQGGAAVLQAALPADAGVFRRTQAGGRRLREQLSRDDRSLRRLGPDHRRCRPVHHGLTPGPSASPSSPDGAIRHSYNVTAPSGEHAVQGIAAEAGVHRLPRPVAFRQVAPGEPGTDLVDDPGTRTSVGQPNVCCRLWLLVDIPSGTEGVGPSAGCRRISRPAAFHVQQVADNGTRLIYDSAASALSVYQDGHSVSVAAACGVAPRFSPYCGASRLRMDGRHCLVAVPPPRRGGLR